MCEKDRERERLTDIQKDRDKRGSGKKSGGLLLFIPKTYSLKLDGRIEAVQVYGIQVSWDLGKH